MSNPHKNRAGLDRVARAAGYSVQGLRAAFAGEAAFRQEVAAAMVLMPLGLWLGGDGVERALLIASVWLVLIVELLNSALEAAIDRISFDHHELSKRCKDMGSAAVLLTIALAGSVWASVLVSRWL